MSKEQRDRKVQPHLEAFAEDALGGLGSTRSFAVMCASGFCRRRQCRQKLAGLGERSLPKLDQRHRLRLLPDRAHLDQSPRPRRREPQESTATRHVGIGVYPPETFHPLQVTAQRRLLQVEQSRHVAWPSTPANSDRGEEVELGDIDAVVGQGGIVDAADHAPEAPHAHRQAVRRDQPSDFPCGGLRHRTSRDASMGCKRAPAHCEEMMNRNGSTGLNRSISIERACLRPLCSLSLDGCRSKPNSITFSASGASPLARRFSATRTNGPSLPSPNWSSKAARSSRVTESIPSPSACQ